MTTQAEAIAMLRSKLAMAIRQNQCDMLMTGEELRECEIVIAATASIEQAEPLTARKQIELGIIYDLINDPSYEYDVGTDADYCTPVTDKINALIKPHIGDASGVAHEPALYIAKDSLYDIRECGFGSPYLTLDKSELRNPVALLVPAAPSPQDTKELG